RAGRLRWTCRKGCGVRWTFTGIWTGGRNLALSEGGRTELKLRPYIGSSLRSTDFLRTGYTADGALGRRFARRVASCGRGKRRTKQWIVALLDGLPADGGKALSVHLN